MGGGYDQYGLLAKHMPRHIPGKPNIVVSNMVGAEGLRVANESLYNVAAQDGTVIGGLSRNTGLARFYGFNSDGIQFDARKFHWLGSPEQEVGLFILSAKSGLHSIDDLKTRQVTVSSTAIIRRPRWYSAPPQCHARHQAQADQRLCGLAGLPSGARAQ